MLLQIANVLGRFGWLAQWGALFLVLAILCRKRRTVSVLLTVGAIGVPLASALPVVAIALEKYAERCVRSTLRNDIEYDVAIVLSGKAEERVEPALDLIRSRQARSVLYSGKFSPGEAKVLASTLRSRRIRDEQILFEQESRNTHENAVEAARIVRERGWKRVVLVTGAVHARRALASFRKVGLSPDLLPVFRKRPGGFLPQLWAIDASAAVVHESLGLVAYRIAGYAE